MENYMLLHVKAKVCQGWCFQQDELIALNTLQRLQKIGLYLKVHVLEWPSQSLDLNPIEHIWEGLEHQIREEITLTKRI